MTRWLLLLFFVLMLTGDMLGMNVGLAPGLSVKNAFLYMIVLIIAIEAAITRNRRLELLSVVAPYALCIFYAGFTSLVLLLLFDRPEYRAISFIMALKGGLADHLLVFLIYFYGLMTTKDALWLLRRVIWVVLVVNLVCLMDYLNLPDLGLLQPLKEGRFGGAVSESNLYGVFLALFIPAAGALVWLEKGVRRQMVIFGVFALVIALLFASSRGSLVGVVMGTVIATFYLKSFIPGGVIRNGALGVMAGLFVALGVLSVTGYLEPIVYRVVDQSIGANAGTMSSGRTEIWGFVLGKMIERPTSLVTGFGWDAYHQSFSFRFAPHNTYLRIYFELGVIGLSLVIAALVNLCRTARSVLRQTNMEAFLTLAAFVFGLSALMVAIVFVDLGDLWLMVWAYAGVSMRLAVCEEACRKHGRNAVIGPWTASGHASQVQLKMGVRVAHIISGLVIGGAERHLVNLLNALDCEYRAVICTGTAPAGPSFCSDLDPAIELVSIPVRRRSLPAGIWRLSSALKRMRVNVVHTHMFDSNLYGALAARLAGVPVVVTSEHGENPWKRPFHQWLERRIISPLVDVRFCVSEQILARRRDLDGVPVDKLMLTVNGTPLPSRPIPALANGIPVIGAVGRFIKAKGYPYLLEAVSELRRRGYQLEVCIVGDGPEMNHIREAIHRLELEQIVTLPGLVTDVDLWYERLDIYVSSSIREGLPVALLEAMAHGLPVVATDVGASADTVGDRVGGLIVPPGDSIAIADAVASMLESKTDRKAFGTRARARVEKTYSVRAVAGHHLSVYSDILERKGSA